MNIKNINQLIDRALDSARVPLTMITGYLVYATASRRPGISRIKTSADIISDNEDLGINTGEMPDGTENVVNKFVYNMVEKVVDSLKDDAKVECVIPIGSVVVKATGANVGGPIEAVGTNINNAKGYGVIR